MTTISGHQGCGEPFPWAISLEGGEDATADGGDAAAGGDEGAGSAGGGAGAGDTGGDESPVNLGGATTVRGKFPPQGKPGEILVRVDPKTGDPTNYQVYGPNGLPIKRVDVVGRDHDGIPTPHVHEFKHNVNPHTGETFVNKGPVRPARPHEIP